MPSPPPPLREQTRDTDAATGHARPDRAACQNDRSAAKEKGGRSRPSLFTPYSQALAWNWPRFLTRKRRRVGAVSRLAAAGRFRESRRVHIISLRIQAGPCLWLGRCGRPSFLERWLARSPITVVGVRHSILRCGNAARHQEHAKNQNVFAHVDILLSINVSAVEAFRCRLISTSPVPAH
jgi:hypothetical protein